MIKKGREIMYKLLLLGTMIGIGVGIAKFMKKKKQNVQEETSSVDTNQQVTPSVAQKKGLRYEVLFMLRRMEIL